MLFMSCVCHAFASGKGLTSWLLFIMFNCDFVILSQVWYLIVSIRGLCRLSYMQYSYTVL